MTVCFNAGIISFWMLTALKWKETLMGEHNFIKGASGIIPPTLNCRLTLLPRGGTPI